MYITQDSSTDTFHVGASTFHVAHDVISANLVNGNIEIVRRYPSNMCYGNGTQAPDRIVKEIYGSVDGKVQLVQTITGKHTPGHFVKETFEFEND